jgi:hypothetical protein
MLRATQPPKGAEMLRGHFRSSVLPLSLFAASFLPAACGGSGDSSPAVCGELSGYHATVAGPLSFATDVYPILASTSTAGGCAQVSACHGSTALPINSLGSKTLQFLYGTDAAPVMDATMAKTQLMMTSVNAPSMQRVVAGSVGTSLLAYKISGKDAITCIKSMCQSGASVGTAPCGDPMPTLGVITDGDRTKILDWIALGAAN